MLCNQTVWTVGQGCPEWDREEEEEEEEKVEKRLEVTSEVWLVPSQGRRVVWWQIPGCQALSFF
jgi:hypothetical protein